MDGCNLPHNGRGNLQQSRRPRYDRVPTFIAGRCVDAASAPVGQDAYAGGGGGGRHAASGGFGRAGGFGSDGLGHAGTVRVAGGLPAGSGVCQPVRGSGGPGARHGPDHPWQPGCARPVAGPRRTGRAGPVARPHGAHAVGHGGQYPQQRRTGGACRTKHRAGQPGSGRAHRAAGGQPGADRRQRGAVVVHRTEQCPDHPGCRSPGQQGQPGGGAGNAGHGACGAVGRGHSAGRTPHE